jgi:hypothetical protein
MAMLNGNYVVSTIVVQYQVGMQKILESAGRGVDQIHADSDIS